MKLFKKSTALFASFVLATLSLTTQAKITVFAASSMTNALEEAKIEFLKLHPNEDIAISFASSSKLARQIENGAEANIFISANQKWMDYLEEKNVILTSSRVNLVANRLVMIAPESSKVNQINVTDANWINLLKNSYLAVGDPDAVPAGKYAKEALNYLQQWSMVKDKLARGQNVRVALAYVERGESPLGIVYATDAKMSKKVKVVAIFPSESHAKILYPASLIKGQENTESQMFLDYLRSQAGKKIFADYGFIPE